MSEQKIYQQFAHVIILKVIYQIMYLLVCFASLKSLSVSDFGFFSYFLSVTTYFATFSLLGLPFYLQSHIARNKPIDCSYLVFSGISIFVVLLLITTILPETIKNNLVFILLIAVANILYSIAAALFNGRRKFVEEYKMLLLSSCWMPVLLIYHYLYPPLSLASIILFWGSNSIFTIIYIMICVYSNWRENTFTINNQEKSYAMVLVSLILFYAPALPFEFSKFYDRFLLLKFFNSETLGVYAFNSTIVIIAYAMFILPASNIYLTLLSGKIHSLGDQMRLINRYYLHVSAIYLLTCIFYLPFSNSWLNFAGFIGYRNVRNGSDSVYGSLYRVASELNSWSAKSDPHASQSSPVCIPAGHFLNWRHGVRGYIPSLLTQKRWKQMLEDAIRTNSVLHMWSHPHNFITGEGMYSLLEEILKLIALERQNGRICLMTQRNYCKFINAGIPR